MSEPMRTSGVASRPAPPADGQAADAAAIFFAAPLSAVVYLYFVLCGAQRSGAATRKPATLQLEKRAAA